MRAGYDFLYGQADLALALENGEIALFRNEHPVARAYGVNSMVYVENLEEYLELSQTQDVMEHLYILGGGTGVGNRSPMEKLDIVRKNPVKYQVEGSQKNYTIFTIPQMVSGEWEYNGQLAMKNLGFMPAFESDEEGGSVVYKRFYYAYLPSYIVSLIALAFMGGYYFLSFQAGAFVGTAARQTGPLSFFSSGPFKAGARTFSLCLCLLSFEGSDARQLSIRGVFLHHRTRYSSCHHRTRHSSSHHRTRHSSLRGEGVPH